MSTDNNFPEDKDKPFPLELESLALSDKLKQKGLVQSITIDRKANIIKVTLNHGSNTPIISPIYPTWIKTIACFSKLAKRKNLSDEDIVNILDVFDDNHEAITNHLLDNSGQKIQLTDKVKEETLIAIDKLRSNHKDITMDEWKSSLLTKHQALNQ